jgi:hypothetical protein
VAPAELAALGYLPDDTDMIVAVHVSEALDDPAGRDLLRSVGLGGKDAPDMEKWTGLKLDDIDHLALGLKLDADLLTRFVLVAQARRPIDQQRVRDVLKADAGKEEDGRRSYPFVMETGLPLIANEDAARAVQAFFEPNNRKGARGLIDPQEAGPLGRELLDSLTATRREAWVDLQAKAHAEAPHVTK